MSWRDSIKKDQPKIRVAPHWKNTIRPEGPKVIHGRDGLNGKDGSNGLNGRNGLGGKNGVNGKNGLNGNDGLNGSQIYFVASVSDDFGFDGDLAILDKTLDILGKENGQWFKRGSLKVIEKKQTLVTGGVSESFVNAAIQNAISTISGGSEIIETVSNDYIVTNETHLYCLVSSQKTMTLPSTKAASITIKNSATSTASVIVSGANLDGQTDWSISPGSAFRFTPISAGNYDVN